MNISNLIILYCRLPLYNSAKFLQEDSDRRCLFHEHFKSYHSILQIATLQFC